MLLHLWFSPPVEWAAGKSQGSVVDVDKLMHQQPRQCSYEAGDAHDSPTHPYLESRREKQNALYDDKPHKTINKPTRRKVPRKSSEATTLLLQETAARIAKIARERAALEGDDPTQDEETYPTWSGEGELDIQPRT